MTRNVFASCAVVIAALLSRPAIAQTQPPAQGDSPQWLKDRQYSEGIGFRTGDVELHLGAAGEVGYDSNWLLRTDRADCTNLYTGRTQPCDNGKPAAPVVPSIEFRLTPSFSVATLGPQRREGDASATAADLAFRAGVSATYRAFGCLASNCSGASDISSQNNLSALSVVEDARLDILPEHPFGAAVFETFSRAPLPNFTNADPNLAFTNDTIMVGGELGVQPGGGTLDWHLGYQFRDVLFEQTPGQAFDNVTHTVSARGRWKFRPRTALVYDGALGFTTYSNSTQAAQQGLVNSTPARARIGINGLVTDRFSFLGVVGWAASFNDTSVFANSPQYDSVIGQAELRWFIAASPGGSALSELGLALSSIALGYTRDVQSSYLGNYYGSDRGYLRFNYFFAGRALVSLEGGLGAVEYPDLYWLPPTTAAPTLRHKRFTDLRADATLFTEYRFSTIFGLNATLRYTGNFSSTHDMPDGPQPTNMGFFDMGWSRFEAFLGARVFW